jgi:serine/threonine protein kinase
MSDFFEDKFKTKPYPAQTLVEDADILSTFSKTIPYPGISGDVDILEKDMPTRAYQPAAKQPQRTASHNLGIGDSVELNSIRYEILEILSDEGQTSEAIIYKVKDIKNRIFALKLYYEFTDVSLEPNSDTLQRIRELGGEDVLFLFDFGTGPNKHKGKYCFEITQYAAGGDLASVKNFEEKYSLDFIENVIVKSIFRGLAKLHDRKIYHCDLKPQNVFFLDEAQTKVVIGDYGSAKSFEISSEKELSFTTVTKGTEFYLAPEQAFGIVSEKNDYYSLGMILLHLLYPGQVTRQNLRRIFERRTKGLPIIDFDDRYKRFNKLIEGLTLSDYNNRWGSKEVAAWLDGKEVEINYRGTARQHLIIGSHSIKNGKDLAEFIKNNNSFYDSLIEDKEGYGLLLDWIKNNQGENNMKQFDSLVMYYKKFFGFDYLREAIIFYFDPLHKVILGLEEFDFSQPEQIKETTKLFFKALDDIWKINDLETLRLHFFKFEFALRRLRVKSEKHVVNFIDKTFGKLAMMMNARYRPDFSELKAELYVSVELKHLPQIFYYFDNSRNFKDLRNNEYSTWFEVCELLKSSPPKSDNDLLQLEKTAFLENASKDDLIEFVDFSDDIHFFLLNSDLDFNALINLILRYSTKSYKASFLKKVILHYRDENAAILREVILRLIDPELPVSVKGQNIFINGQGDLQSNVNRFFALLDDELKETDIDKIAQKFFGFEFSLLQLSNEDNQLRSALAEPMLTKLCQLFDTPHHNRDELSAKLYLQLNDKILTEIFYHFAPTRGFRSHDGSYLKKLSDIGFYYIRNPEMFDYPNSAAERETFLRRSGNRSLLTATYDDFVISVFQTHAIIEISVVDIIFDQNGPNEVSVFFNYVISIDEYLQSQGYEVSFYSRNKTLMNAVFKKKPFSSDGELFDMFQEVVKLNQGVNSVSKDSRKSFLQVLAKKKQSVFWLSLTLLPRYLLYLLPAYGILFLSLSFVYNTTVFSELLTNIFPSLKMVSVRVASSYFSTLLYVAYIINLITAFNMLLPVLSLRRKRQRFIYYMDYYGPNISRFILILIFAPIFFLAIYAFFSGSFGAEITIRKDVEMTIDTIWLSIFLYVIFLFYQVIKIIGTFFKVSRQIKLIPMIIAILIYLLPILYRYKNELWF